MARTVVFAEQTLSGFVYDDAFGCYAATAPTLLFTLTEGQEYVAVVDGVEYTLTAVAFTNGTSECVYIGNTLTQGGANNGIPFAVVCDITYGYTHVMSLDTATSHTVALYIDDEPEPEPEPEPDPTTPYVQLYDRAGAPGDYEIGKGIRLFSADGTPRDFISANLIETTIQPDFSNGDMEVSPDEGTLFSKVTVSKPPNLVPENISNGITIAGVKGEMEAGSIGDKPIRFYDPLGNVIYGYTRAEIQDLTELPAGPTLSGLTFERWTHTLEELKSVTYFADVGPMYMKGSDPVTVLILEIGKANTTIQVNTYMWSSSWSTTIDWGDGATSTIKGKSSGNCNASHTYTTTGVKIVIFSGTTICHLGFKDNTSRYNVIGNSLALSLTVTPINYLISVLTSSKMTSSYPVNFIECLAANQRLRFLSLYNANTRGGTVYMFLQNPCLKAIAGNTPLNNIASYQHYGNVSLKRLNVSGNISANSFDMCDSLEEVIFGSGKITDVNMNSKWAMLMTTETPPTIGATSPVWGTKPIYVPDSAVDTYKAASGWSNAAAYIFPASSYPDK